MPSVNTESCQVDINDDWNRVGNFQFWSICFVSEVMQCAMLAGKNFRQEIKI